MLPQELKMMRKSLWMIAVLIAAVAVPSAMADTTNYNITFDNTHSGGANVAGSYSASGGSLVNFAITIPSDSDHIQLISNGALAAGVSCSASCPTAAGMLSELQSGGTTWLLNSVEASTCGATATSCQMLMIYNPAYNGGVAWQLFFQDSNKILDGGSQWQGVPVPEPPVYMLALLGVFFTRNRISQRLRQAIRWNYRLPSHR